MPWDDPDLWEPSSGKTWNDPTLWGQEDAPTPIRKSDQGPIDYLTGLAQRNIGRPMRGIGGGIRAAGEVPRSVAASVLDPVGGGAMDLAGVPDEYQQVMRDAARDRNTPRLGLLDDAASLGRRLRETEADSVFTDVGLDAQHYGEDLLYRGEAKSEVDKPESITGDPLQALKYYTDMGAGSALSFGAAMLNGPGGLALMGLESGGNEYATRRDEGVSPLDAAGAGVANAVFELVPESKALRIIKGPFDEAGGALARSKLAKAISNSRTARTIGAAGGESMTEFSTGMLQGGYGKVVMGDDKSWGDVFDESVDQGLAGAAIGGPAGFLHASVAPRDPLAEGAALADEIAKQAGLTDMDETPGVTPAETASGARDPGAEDYTARWRAARQELASVVRNTPDIDLADAKTLLDNIAGKYGIRTRDLMDPVFDATPVTPPEATLEPPVDEAPVAEPPVAKNPPGRVTIPVGDVAEARKQLRANGLPDGLLVRTKDGGEALAFPAGMRDSVMQVIAPDAHLDEMLAGVDAQAEQEAGTAVEAVPEPTPADEAQADATVEPDTTALIDDTGEGQAASQAGQDRAPVGRGEGGRQDQPVASAEPVVLQNRDRSTQASIEQVTTIAANPDYLRTGPSRTMDQGAPVVFGDLPDGAVLGKRETITDNNGNRYEVQYAVVNADAVLPSHDANGNANPGYANGEPGRLRVTSGNARAEGLRTGSRKGTMGAYRKDLAADESGTGVAPDRYASIPDPILVRVMRAEDVTPDIGDRGNVQAGAKLSAVEQAANDTRRVRVEDLEFREDGTPTDASLRKFIAAMPVGERNEMLNRDGTPTRQAHDRLMAAVFRQAYDNDELVRLYAQATDPDARNVMHALAGAASDMAGLRNGGVYDVRDLVTQAAREAVNAVRSGQSLKKRLQNMDLDSDPRMYVVADFFADNIRTTRELRAGLVRLATKAREQIDIVEQNKTQGGMFGDRPTASLDEVLSSIRGDEHGGQHPTSEGGSEPVRRVAEGQADDARAGQAGTRDGRGSGRGEAGESAGAEGQVTVGPDGDTWRVEASSRDLFTKTRGHVEREQQTRTNQGDRRDGDTGHGAAQRPDEGRVGPDRPSPSEVAGRAINALESLVRRFGGSVLFDRISRDFRAGRAARLIGQKVESIEDLAAAVQVYRNPMFETLRYIFVDDAGRVVGESAVSARMPASSDGFPRNMGEAWLRDSMRRFGASGFWMTHNHPSGHPSPSGADVSFTSRIKGEFPDAFRGHVVTDHNTYGVVGGAQHGIHDLKNAPEADPLASPDARGSLSTIELNAPSTVALVAREYISAIADGKAFVVMSLTSRRRLSSVTAFPESALRGPRAAAAGTRLAALSGAGTQIAVVPKRIYDANRRLFKKAARVGLFMDIRVVDESGRLVSLAERREIDGWFASRALGRGSRSITREVYNTGEDAPRTEPKGQPDMFAVAEQQGDLFGGPTDRDRLGALEREKGAQRNGRRGGKEDDGDGGLFDGKRPEQARIPDAQQTDSEWLAQALTDGVTSEQELAGYLAAKRHPEHEARFQRDATDMEKDAGLGNLAHRIWNGGQKVNEDGSGYDVSGEDGGPKNLYVFHNITPEGLRHADELGGLAAPSLGVGNLDVEAVGKYGEITLVAGPEMLQSPKAKTFDSDVYSPRQPRAEYRIKGGAALGKMKASGMQMPTVDDLSSKDGPSRFAASPAAQYVFLSEQGKLPRVRKLKVSPEVRKAARADSDDAVAQLAEKFYRRLHAENVSEFGEDNPITRRRYDAFFDESGNVEKHSINWFRRDVAAYRQSGGKDTTRFITDMGDRVRRQDLKSKFSAWVRKQFNSIVDGRQMFDGFTASGRKRYKAYTMANIVKAMTRELRNGENWNYAAGSVRAAYAGEMKSVKAVQAKRDNIVSENDFDAIREESNQRLQNALDELKPYYKYSADGYSYIDDASSAIAEGPRGWQEAFDMTPEAREIITGLTDYLRGLPTEYFETKVGRSVGLDEFNVAVVPRNADKSIVDMLKQKGLEVRLYTRGNKEDRARAIRGAKRSAMFSRVRPSEMDRPVRTSKPAPQSPANAGLSISGAEKAAEKSWGKRLVRRLKANGILNFVTAEQMAGLDIPEIRSVSDTDGVQGLYDPRTGKAYVVVDNVTAKDVGGVILHEIGTHFGVHKIVGAKTFNAITARMQALRGKDADIDRAFAAVPEDTNPAHRAEEAMGYLVEQAPKHTLVKRLMDAMKRGLNNLGIPMPKIESEVDAIRRIARENLRAASKVKGPVSIETGANGSLFQRLWHGGPHRGIENEGFRLHAIGSGEGAQAYGWGIYFADAREVAEGYRERLTGDVEYLVDGEPLPQGDVRRIWMRDVAEQGKDAARARLLDDAKAEHKRELEIAKMVAKRDREPVPDDVPMTPRERELRSAADDVAAFDVGRLTTRGQGQLYSAELPDNLMLLDWDKPLSEQPESVRQSLRKLLLSDAVEQRALDDFGVDTRAQLADTVLQPEHTGDYVYGTLSDVFRTPQGASEALGDAGIKGLRYLDGNSRNAGGGTSNYVIWDEALLTPEAAQITPYYSRTKNTKNAYEARIDALFDGDTRNRQGVKILDRADILDLLGHGDQPLHLVESAVGKKELGSVKHPNMTAEQWKKVPEWIENPAAVFRTQSEKHPDRLVLFAPDTVNGRPVRIILDPNGEMGGLDVHVAVNAYDEGGTHVTPVDKWVKEGDLLYLDPKASPALNERSGLRLPRDVRQLRGYDHRVLTESDLVNYRAERDNGPKFSRAGAEKQAAVKRDILRNELHNATDNPITGGAIGWNFNESRWEGKKGTVSRARADLQDKLLAWKHAQDDIATQLAKTIPDAQNVYRLETLMHGRVKERTDKLEDGRIVPLVKAMDRAGVKPADLDEYLYARHATERNREVAKLYEKSPNLDMFDDVRGGKLPDGFGSGMTNAEARDILARADARKMEPLARMVDGIVRNTRKEMLDGGIITQQQYDAMSGQYEYWVPLRGKERGENEYAPSGTGTGRGMDGRTGNIRRAFGRGAGNRATDILGNIIGDAQRTIINTEKARVGRGVLSLVLANPNPKLWTVEPVKTELAINANGDVYDKVVDDWNDPTILAVKHKGKIYKIQFENVRLAKALNNIGVDGMGEAMRVAGSINRYFSAVLTQYNPAFTLVNMSRDAMFGLTGLAVEHGEVTAAKAAWYYPTALRAAYRHARGKGGDSEADQYAREFAEDGGRTGYSHMPSVEELSKKIGNGRLGSYNPKGVHKMARAVGDVVGVANDAVENALRLSAYVTLRKKGMSREAAAEYAKDLTVNFNRKGFQGSKLNALFLFYNASMQGVARTGKLMKSPKTWAYLGAMSAMQVVATMYAMGVEGDDGEPIANKIPDYVKERNLWFTWLDENGEQQLLTIPMPYGFNIFPYLAGRTTQAMMNRDTTRDDDNVMAIVADTISAAVGSFSPIPIDQGAFGVVPVVPVKMWLQLQANRNDFGNRIRWENAFGKYDVPRASLGKPDTLELFKVMADGLKKIGGGSDRTPPPLSALDVAPEDIEFILKRLGGGLGRFVIDVATLGEKAATMPENVTAKDFPITSRFFTTRDDKAAQASMFYDRRAEIERNADRVRDVFQQEGDAEALDLLRSLPGLKGADFHRYKTTQKGHVKGQIIQYGGKAGERGRPQIVVDDPGSVYGQYRTAARIISAMRDNIESAYIAAPPRAFGGAERDKKILDYEKQRAEAQKAFNKAWNRDVVPPAGLFHN